MWSLDIIPITTPSTTTPFCFSQLLRRSHKIHPLLWRSEARETPCEPEVQMKEKHRSLSCGSPKIHPLLWKSEVRETPCEPGSNGGETLTLSCVAANVFSLTYTTLFLLLYFFTTGFRCLGVKIKNTGRFGWMVLRCENDLEKSATIGN